MHLFLAESIEGNIGYLSKDESHHASRVLRLQAGENIYVTLGKGTIWEAEIDQLSKTQCRFTLGVIWKTALQEKQLHIAMAPTKNNDRFEFFLEKATEIGINEITPIICDHSERKVYKTERGQKIISAAAKQSQSCWWPILNEPVNLQNFLVKDYGGAKFIAHCENQNSPNILKELPTYPHLLMLIGPEGDFSKREIEKAREHSFVECSLGSKRLRTETAGLAVALAAGLL